MKKLTEREFVILIWAILATLCATVFFSDSKDRGNTYTELCKYRNYFYAAERVIDLAVEATCDGPFLDGDEGQDYFDARQAIVGVNR